MTADLKRRFICVMILLACLGSSRFNAAFCEVSGTIPSPDYDALRTEPRYSQWWGEGPEIPPLAPCPDPGTCVKCHPESALMDERHAFTCATCHKGNPAAEDKDMAHRLMIPRPGDLDAIQETCGTCHPDVARKVRGSGMALAPRLINHTRFAFGAQKGTAPIFGTSSEAGVRKLPEYRESGNFVDDLLRRSCLRCHLRAAPGNRAGEHRGRGCAACHFAVPNTETGQPRRHAIVRNVGITACLKCHNSNHVGADFVGLYEKDFDRGFRSPLVGGRAAPRIYGAEQHRLSPDAHFRAGMYCVDCHTLDDVHGTGDVRDHSLPRISVKCEDCHVTGAGERAERRGAPDRFVLKRTGRAIPRWDPEGSAHRIESHRRRVSCAACHAAWSFQDYGFHLMLEERPDYWKWAHLAGWNDPQIQALLEGNIGTEGELIAPRAGIIPARPEESWSKPATRDLLTGVMRPGAWFGSLTARLWSDAPLGVDHNGKVVVLRPMRQYVISHVDANDNLLVDRKIPTTGAGAPAMIWNPYSPHTIAPSGRPCHGCHGAPKALGLGEGMMGGAKPGLKPLWLSEKRIPGQEFRWDAIVDEAGTPLQSTSRSGAGPLDFETLKKLQTPSRLFKKRFYEFLSGRGTRPEEAGP